MVKSVGELYDGISGHGEEFHRDWGTSIARQQEGLRSLVGGLGLAPGSRFLDVTCGMGTQLIALAQLGYRVAGSDVSAKQVERCRRELERRGIDAELFVSDVCELDTGQFNGFDAAISFGNSLPLVGSAERMEAALRRVSGALRPGGYFISALFDYTAVRETKQRITAYAVYDDQTPRRMWYEVADWHPDGVSFRSHIYFVTHGVSGCETKHYPFECLYALTPREYVGHAENAGLEVVEHRPTATSGFHFELFVMRKPG